MYDEIKSTLVGGFREQYGREPAVVTRAPGRLEILGNHTDYNEGVVLSVAVDRATFFAASVREGTTECRVKDLRDGSSRSFDLNDLASPRPRDWANYVKGILVCLQEKGHQLPAFDAALLSTVPLSAGMSSSAAFEMSVAYALKELAGISLPWVEWAKIGQHCENNYVGAKTGLLDQFSSLQGKAGQLVFSDFRSLEVANVPIPAGTALVVANCMVKHNLTNEYNERREQCEAAVAALQKRFPEVKALRDVSMEQLDANKDCMDIMAYRRAKHVVGENERVIGGIADLEKGDLDSFGARLFESHESSRVHFENSCDELDVLVEIAKSLDGRIGARLSGGGFGGITVHLVQEDAAEDYSRRLATAYETRTGKRPDVMICHAADGAEVLD